MGKIATGTHFEKHNRHLQSLTQSPKEVQYSSSHPEHFQKQTVKRFQPGGSPLEAGDFVQHQLGVGLSKPIEHLEQTTDCLA